MGERFWIRGALALAAALFAAPAASAEDARAALQASCWQPAVLAAKPGENIAVRLQRPAAMRLPNEPAAAATPSPATGLGAIRRVTLPPGRKLIALTFDLCETAGETAGYDGAIVDYLRSQRVRATFFAGGRWVLSHRERARQLLSDPLFEIGTHGWAHRNTRLLAGAELRREIVAPTLAYQSARSELSQSQCAKPHAAALSSIPERPRLFRFPFGACNRAGLQAVADAGLLAIQWDVATGDPSPGQSARAIAAAMIRGAQPGSIVIMHANGRGYNSARALPLAIPALRAKGFEFVTVSELLAAGEPVVAQTCYDARPGDTDRYDFLFRRGPSVSSSWEPAVSHARAAPTVPH
jgi:peptidoglycan/xylan/chitin deacetylase (PgdA/CDA1 family)